MRLFAIFIIGLLIIFNIPTKETNEVSNVSIELDVTMDTLVVSDSKLPNLDTLAAYILTQSKTDSIDINCMVQVMLNRFEMSGFRYISNMLYSNTSYGSGTVKRGGGRYWFTDKCKKYLPLVESEIQKVLDGVVYYDMGDAKYFSNHGCTYHSGNPKYKFVLATKKHKYYIS